MNINSIFFKLKLYLIIGGLAILLMGLRDMYVDTTSAINYNNTQNNNLSWGTVVEGELPLNYGIFSKKTTKIETNEYSTLSYLIPIATDHFSSLDVRNKELQSQLNKQYNDYVNAQNSSEIVTIPSVHFRGIVRPMRDNTIRRIKRYLISSGTDASEIENRLVSYQIYCKEFSNWLNTIIFGSALFLIGIVFSIIQYRDNKKPSK